MDEQFKMQIRQFCISEAIKIKTSLIPESQDKEIIELAKELSDFILGTEKK